MCKKNYVNATYRDRFVVCYECQKKQMQGEIKDPKIKKLFDIPEEFYKDNSFLRDIKIKYLKYDNLTDRQIEAFDETVKKMKENRNKAKEDISEELSSSEDDQKAKLSDIPK